jgi:hypothetical protein
VLIAKFYSWLSEKLKNIRCVNKKTSQEQVIVYSTICLLERDRKKYCCDTMEEKLFGLVLGTPRGQNDDIFYTVSFFYTIFFFEEPSKLATAILVQGYHNFYSMYSLSARSKNRTTAAEFWVHKEVYTMHSEILYMYSNST